MDALIALAPALGVDGAALVCLWMKRAREGAAVRIQCAARRLHARRRLSDILREARRGRVESWDVISLYPWALLPPHAASVDERSD